MSGRGVCYPRYAPYIPLVASVLNQLIVWGNQARGGGGIGWGHQNHFGGIDWWGIRALEKIEFIGASSPISKIE